MTTDEIRQEKAYLLLDEQETREHEVAVWEKRRRLASVFDQVKDALNGVSPRNMPLVLPSEAAAKEVGLDLTSIRELIAEGTRLRERSESIKKRKADLGLK